MIPKIISHRYDEDCGKVKPNSKIFEIPTKKLKYILGNSEILKKTQSLGEHNSESFWYFFLIQEIISHRYDEECGKVIPNSEIFEIPDENLKYILGNSEILKKTQSLGMHNSESFWNFFLKPEIISHRCVADCGKVNQNSEIFEIPDKNLKYILENSGILKKTQKLGKHNSESF